MAAWESGAVPEEIALRFPSVAVEDVYAVCAWALRHREQVAQYLTRRSERADALEASVEGRFGLTGLRGRLRSRRK